MKIKLDDVCERGSSNLKQSDVIDKTGEFPIYGASGYIGNVDFYHQERPYVAIVKDGAGIGRAMLLPAKSSVIGTMQYLLPKENILPKYLYYVVKYMHLEKYFTGATIPHIYFRDYKNEEFNCESLEIQSEIVNILEKSESIISARKQQLQKLDELVKARFVELFGDPVACKNKRKLSEIGKVFTGNTPSMKELSYYESNDIPFIKPSDLNESGVTSIDGVEAYISEKARPVARIIPPDAVLVTCIGTIGKIGISARESCCNQQINFIIPNDGINSVYLAHCLTFFKSTLQNIANAPVVPIINKTQFSELKIPVFDTAKQNQFAAFVEQTDKSKFVVQKALDEAQLLFDSLMQEYFG